VILTAPAADRDERTSGAGRSPETGDGTGGPEQPAR
jgi:hypothetical protein